MSRTEHLGRVGQRLTVTGRIRTLTRLDRSSNGRPDPVLIVLDVGLARVKIVTAARWARQCRRGDRITVAGTVTAHTRWHGTNQTVLARVVHLDAQHPATEPDWELVNPTESGPRPFPGRPTHWPKRTSRRKPDHRTDRQGEAR
ncbi:MAG: hypothetical protein VB036_12715 [Propionicimonas sp.]|nr:hypothetical protein [Propionicimonas sp.]